MMTPEQRRGDGTEWPADLLYGGYRVRPHALARRVEAFRERLLPHLRAWARHGVHFSLSPWNSPAWIGLLYGGLYQDAAEFSGHALEEYARCFNAACIGLGPYALPAASTLLQEISQMPSAFGCVAVVTHEVMMYRFPYGHPEPAKRGALNPRFLDPALMRETVVPLLHLLDPHLRVVVLRPGRIYPTEGYRLETFLERLDTFLPALPQTYRYAVELTTPEYVHPAYFACLHRHRTAGVLGQGNGMPPLLELIERPDALTADVVVVRADSEGSPVLPWNRTGGMDAELRLGILETVRRCVEARKTLYIDLEDRPGCLAPTALLGLMALLDPDLARLSPLRKNAA